MRRPTVLVGAGLLPLVLAGCAETRRVVPLTSPPDSSSETALIVAWLLLVAVGGAIISTVVRRGGTRRTSFVHAVEVGVVAGAALGLVGLAAVVALAGWIADSGSPRAGPSILQVSVTDPADDLLETVVGYLWALLLAAGQLLAFAILIGRAGCPRWRRVRGVRGVLVTILRVIAFALLLLLDAAGLALLSVYYALIQSFDPTITFSAPGDQILLGLLGVTMLTAQAILFVRLLFREFLGPRRQA